MLHDFSKLNDELMWAGDVVAVNPRFFGKNVTELYNGSKAIVLLSDKKSRTAYCVICSTKERQDKAQTPIKKSKVFGCSKKNKNKAYVSCNVFKIPHSYLVYNHKQIDEGTLDFLRYESLDHLLSFPSEASLSELEYVIDLSDFNSKFRKNRENDFIRFITVAYQEKMVNELSKIDNLSDSAFVASQILEGYLDTLESFEGHKTYDYRVQYK